MTLGNIKTYIRDRSKEDGSTRFDRIMEDIANDAHRALHGSGLFDFDKRYGELVLAGVYSTGTVSVTAGGTAVTGSGTTFTSAMANRYIRLDGENKIYFISAYVSGTELTIDAYQGDTDLSGVNYEIIMPRVAAPSRFRCVVEPGGDDNWCPILRHRTVQSIKRQHRLNHSTGQPVFYGIENAEASSVPTPWFWVHPAPYEEEILEIPYYVWPDDMTSDSDVFEIPFEAEDLLKMFVDAYLARYHKEPQWPVSLEYAKAEALRALGSTRQTLDGGCNEMWTPDSDVRAGMGYDYKVRWASGEPAYQ